MERKKDETRINILNEREKAMKNREREREREIKGNILIVRERRES